MDNLIEIKQLTPNAEPEHREALLPDEKRSCLWINEKGANEGSVCGRSCFSNFKYCAAHTTVAKGRNVEYLIKEPEVEKYVDLDKEESEDEESEEEPEEFKIEQPKSSKSNKTLKLEILQSLIKLTQTLFSE